MNHGPAPAIALLLALAAGPAAHAGETAALPDLSAALQSRIEYGMESTLKARAGHRRDASSQQAAAADRRDPRSASTGSGRTDEPGWKPYHSAM